MKKLILIAIGFITITTTAQVKFGNNPTTLATNATFQVEGSSGAQTVILNNGNVGIGTTSPSANLDINGTIKISGGSPGAGKILTSDATGLASWVTPSASTNIYNTNGTLTGNRTVTTGSNTLYFTGTAGYIYMSNATDANLQVMANVATGAALHRVGNSTTFIDEYITGNDASFKSTAATRLDIGTANSAPLNLLTNNTNRLTISSTGNVGIGTTAPNARLDIRTDPTSTSDPGAGMLGIGTTSANANSAGAGAMRYSTATGGQLQYSNGVVWNTLTSTVQKSIVSARKTTDQSFANNAVTHVTNWYEDTDTNSNFDNTTGIFTAPRSGNYIVSFSFNFDVGTIAGTGYVQVQAHLTTNAIGGDRVGLVAYPAGGTAQAGAVVSFVIPMNAGQTVRPSIFQSLGTDKTLRENEGFVNFSVAEL